MIKMIDGKTGHRDFNNGVYYVHGQFDKYSDNFFINTYHFEEGKLHPKYVGSVSFIQPEHVETAWSNEIQLRDCDCHSCQTSFEGI